MSTKYSKSLSLYYRENPEDSGGKVTEGEIVHAELKLNKSFSVDYRLYLKKYGGGAFMDCYISGLKKPESMQMKLPDVIEKTKFYKDQDWPGIDDWYIVSDDGFGNPIGIDPDGKVWLSDHDSGFEKVKLADSFEEFLYKLLTDTLYEE